MDSYSGQSTAEIPRSFPDGQSDTIVFAEWYTLCGGVPRIWSEDGQGAYGGDYAEPDFWFFNPTPAWNGTLLPLPQFQPAVSACNPLLLQGPVCGRHAGGAGRRQRAPRQPGREPDDLDVCRLPQRRAGPRLRLVSVLPNAGRVFPSEGIEKSQSPFPFGMMRTGAPVGTWGDGCPAGPS